MGTVAGGRRCAAAAAAPGRCATGRVVRTPNRSSRPRRHGDEPQRPEVPMNESLKVQPHHLERSAYLYIRQSSMRQVIENAESAKRQYALRGRAIALGWRDEQIIVIDTDQGESGASAAWREGFQRLVSDVGMGHAGIVMGLEVSRLARNNADWQRLLEICALADTLILDEDGVYDPTTFNDRLLLGLKGTMSEAELHVIKARLRGGILNKVRRGEYRCVLPTGLIYDQSGNVTFDPDSQIRETIIHFFDTFSRVGSACQTVKAFRKEGLLFSSRLRNSETTVFRPLTASTAIRVLNNPRYAGTYAYGRRRYRRTIYGKKTLQRRDPDDWLACIPDAHPGYISWEQFQENLKILKTNGRGYDVARAWPPREGTALLQGRAVCGRRAKNDFAFSTLVRCGHCGCALTGDIKKGRYIYYRCTGYKGRCPEPYVPEAVLSRKFSELLRQLDIGEPALQLVSEGLRSSHVDQAKEHAEAIKRLQAEYDRIQSRIQAMYVDKLDAKVDLGMFEHLSADWRKQQERCLREIEQRQSADQHYLEEGVTILEMARNAQRLFDSEEPMQKRRLLNFVVSNSTWGNGELNANLREPFGFIAEMARFTSGGGSSNGTNFADHSGWLGN